MFNGNNPFNPSEDFSATVFRDVILISLLAFVFVIIWMLPHINPEGEQSKDEAPPPGNVIVEIRWPDEMCVDVDMWVKPPKGGQIGFARKSSEHANLLRDDVGCINDPLGLNYENLYTRGILQGQYTVNAHWYTGILKDDIKSVPVRVIVSVKPPGKSMKEILVTEITLENVWQSLTAFSFTLDEHGNLKPGSVNNEWKPIGYGNPEGTKNSRSGDL